MCKHTKVVFTGAGTRAFCAGGNLQTDESGNGSRELFRVRVRVTVRVRIRVPSIGLAVQYPYRG